MKKLLSTLILTLVFYQVSSQTPTFSDITILDNPSIFPSDAVVDDSGNTYIIGTFLGNPDWDPGASTVYALDPGKVLVPGSDGYEGADTFADGFIAKYTSSGTLEWVYAMWTRGPLTYLGYDTDPSLFLRDITIDDSGNVYFVGDIKGIADGIGNQVQGSELANNALSRAFVRGFAPNGSIILQADNDETQLSSASTGHGIAVDGSGNVYITGEFRYEMNGFTVANNFQDQTYFTKFDNSGARVDQGYLVESADVTYQADQDNGGRSIYVDDSGNIFITGYFEQNASFDGSTTLSSTNSSDVYVAFYNSSKVLQDVKTFTTASEGRQVELDGDGNLIAAFGSHIVKINTSGIEEWDRDFSYDVSFSINDDNDLIVSRLEDELSFVKLLSDNSIDFEIAPSFVSGVQANSSSIKAFEFATGNYMWISDNIEVHNFNGDGINEVGRGIILSKYNFMDEDPPFYSSLSPIDGATNVPVDADFTLTFNEPLVAGTGNIVIFNSLDQFIVNESVTSPNVTISGNTVTLNPGTDLDPGTSYYIRYSSSFIKDTADNFAAPISDATSWNFTTAAPGPNPFVTTWSTDDGTITIPTFGTGYSYDVTWTNLTQAGVGDGNAAGQSSSYTITGLTNGDIYQVEISGNFPRIYFNNGSEKDKILTIENWGDIAWTSFDYAFWGCTNLQLNASDAPDLSSVFLMRGAFRDIPDFTGNASMNTWNTSNITRMDAMFANSSSFDQDLNNWNVSNVVNMTSMFVGATDFNGDISTWTPSKVTNFSSMFLNATSFNSDITNWTTTAAENLSSMFYGASSFSRDISGWSTGNVTSMNNMLRDATSFDQNLGNLNIASVTNISEMLRGSNLSISNYEATLQGWSDQTPNSGLSLGGGNTLVYCDETFRTILTTTYNWTITDKQDCGVEVLSLNPADDSENQGRSINLIISFDEPVTLGSGTITLKYTGTSQIIEEFSIPSSPAVTLSSDQLIIDPTDDFAPGEPISVLIDPGVITDQYGYTLNGFEDDQGWNFTTLDNVAPMIIDQNPANGSSSWNLNAAITISFNENIQERSGGFITLWSEGGTVLEEIYTGQEDPRISINNYRASIDFDYAVEEGTLYQISMNPGSFGDLANNGGPGIAYGDWQITTVTLPSISSLSPLDNATDVDPSDSLTIDFDRDMGADESAQLVIKRYDNDAVIESFEIGEQFYADGIISVTPSSPLPGGQEIYAVIEPIGALSDDMGYTFEGLSAKDDWNFTIAEIPGPEVISFFPEDNATDVSINGNLIVRFNKEIVGGESYVRVYSTSGTPIVSGRPAFDADKFSVQNDSLIIHFENYILYPQQYDTEYYVEINNGAVTDTDGIEFKNGFTDSETWSFTTESNPIQGASLTHASINENNQTGDFIGLLSGISNRENSEFTFAFAGLFDNPSFTISNDSLFANEVFDYETKTEYTIRVRVNDGYGFADQDFTISINNTGDLTQTITFEDIPNKTFGDPEFQLVASSDSELEVSFEIISGENLIDLSNGIVTILGTGDVTIKATQEGDSEFASATPVSQTFTIKKADQTITLEQPIGTKTFGDDPFSPNITTSSGQPVSISYVSGPASVTDNVITLTGAGLVVLEATSSANENYNEANPLTLEFSVEKAIPELSIEPIADKLVTDPSFDIVVSGTVGLTINLSVLGPADISGSTITLTGVGTVVVTATIDESDNYLSATTDISFEVFAELQDQKIEFTLPQGAVFGDGTFTLIENSSAGLPITYSSSNENVATVAGNLLTITGAGTTSITGSQSGNSTFNKASDVTLELIVGKADAGLILEEISDQNLSAGSVSFSATANSNSVISYSVTPASATIQGNTITFTEPGLHTLIATVEETNNYLAAETSQSFEVIDDILDEQSISFPTIDNQVYGNAIVPAAEATSELEISYTVSGPAEFSGNEVIFSGTGTVEITASQAGNDQYAAAEPVTVSFEVEPATLAVSAEDKNIVYGEPLPELTFSVSGFVYDEDESTIIENPTLSTTAEASSDAGTYPIAIAGGVASNYVFEYTAGSLIIEQAQASITLTELEQEADGTPKVPVVTTDPAGLNYSITFDGLSDAPVEAGSYLIEVFIEDINYYGEVTDTFVITTEEEILGGIIDEIEVSVFPNPVVETLTISSKKYLQIVLYDMEGKGIRTHQGQNLKVDMSNLKQGVYLLQITSGNSKTIKRIIKQ